MTTPTTRETIVSGDWMTVGDAPGFGARYTYGYRALVPTCDIHGPIGEPCLHTTWNGWALPSVSAGVAEHMVRDQCAVNARYPQDDDQRIDLSFEDGVLIQSTAVGGPYEYIERIERDASGRFSIGMGWCWSEVDEANCDEIIG